MGVRVTDGFRHLYCSRLNTIERVHEYGLRTWLLLDDGFIPTLESSSGALELQLYDGNIPLACLAKDINRLSCAAVETLSEIRESEASKKFIAWQLVQTYYAAFYAAHSTLKICSFGLTQIDSNTFQNIRKKANLYGISLPQMKAGMYCVDFDSNVSKIKIYNISRYDDSHRGLWQRYIDLIKTLCGTHIRTNSIGSDCIRIRNGDEDAIHSIYSHLPITDSEIIVSRLEAIKDLLNKHGDGNWLSTFRNNLNYNHGYGVWFPYTQHQNEYLRVLEKRELFKTDPLDNQFDFAHDFEIMQFYKCCHLIVSINRELIEDLGNRNSQNKSFLKNGVLHLLKTR